MWRFHMQVKKFEARSMKEALDLVKSQMGPDAIILSVRDNQKSFGLNGEVSIEITAAISENTLHKKNFVESRMRNQEKEIFQKSPAKIQKEIIEKMVSKKLERSLPTPQRRYIDIPDEPSDSGTNIRQTEIPRLTNSNRKPAAVSTESDQVIALKKEIEGLRELLSTFKNVPQQIQGGYPGADYGLVYEMSFLYEKLTHVGLAPEIAAEVLQAGMDTIPASKMKNKAIVEAWVARYILSQVQCSSKLNCKTQVFCGPPGSGKTSSLVKLASQLVLNEGKKIALVTSDTHKVGSAEQLKIYAQILNVPFAIVKSDQEWRQLNKFAEQIDYLLVDMPGLSLRTGGELELIKSLFPSAGIEYQTHLVLSATAKDSDCTDFGRRYSLVGFHDVIFSGLDESGMHGNIYNFSRRFQTPLFGFGIGPRVPEDFEFATPERVLDLLLKITQMNTKEREAI